MALIGLDVGTTGCKVAVIDADSGRTAARTFREYGIDADGLGKAEQDAELVWILSRTALREAMEAAGFPEVTALSISAQGDAVIAVGADGRPLYPAVLGMDYRCRSELDGCAERFDGFSLFQRTGMRPHPINSFLKMLWLRRERPKVFDATVRLVTYSGYVMARLGCPGVEDMCTASRSMAFNLESENWDAEILGAFDFPARLLPKIVPSRSCVGRMDTGLARELGMETPPLIVAGGHDQSVCGVGAGGVDAETAVATTGTAEVLSRFLPRPLLTRGMYDSFYPCYCSVIGSGYFTFALNHVGGLALRWFRDAWCGEEVRAARERGRDPYDVILEAMPEGPSPVFALPHFTGSGTPDCDLSARAAFVGMTLETDRPTLTLALLEGLTFDLRANLDRMRLLGMETSRLRNVGGGSRSRRWLQLKADVLGIPVDVMENPDAGCVGAAILAGAGSGVFPSVEDGVARLVRIAGTCEPRAAKTAEYFERYEAYRDLYRALIGFYSR